MANGDIADATNFLAFYVTGTDLPGGEPRSFPGIRRRIPAIVSQSPVSDDDDGSLVTDAALIAAATATAGPLSVACCVTYAA